MDTDEINSQALRYALQLAGNRPTAASDVLNVATRFATFMRDGEADEGEFNVLRSHEEYGAQYPDGTVKWDSELFDDLSREQERDMFRESYREQLRGLGADPSLADSLVFVRRVVKQVAYAPETVA